MDGQSPAIRSALIKVVVSATNQKYNVLGEYTGVPNHVKGVGKDF